jgi:Pectate lyase superfamily protein
MLQMQFWGAIVAAVGLIAIADGQTTEVDLRTQSKSVDFSGALTTKPFKAGVALPATCGVGEAFFQTNATAGLNLYGCTAVNTWTLLSSPAFNPALIPTHDTIHADENYQASSNGTTAMTTISPDKALTTYTAGQCFDFTTDTSNPVSVNIDGLGAQSFTLGDGATTLPDGAVLAQYPFTACYDGTVFRLKNSSASIVAPERFDVKQAPYGAQGNGTTDDTAAIQRALTAAYNAGGGTVYFPCGTYALATPTGAHSGPGYYYLLAQSGVHLEGESKECATLQPTNYAGQTGVTTIAMGTINWDLGAFQWISTINGNTFYALNATAQGNNSITLATAGQASNFAYGNYVAIYYVSAQTALTSAMTSSQTTLTMPSVTGIPASYPFTVLVDYDEQMTVTSLASGTTYNVTRGVTGTAVPHAMGAAVQLVFNGNGVSPGETSVVTSSNASTGVVTLAYPLARSFSNAIIANVTSAAAHDINVSDLTVYCQLCFSITDVFGASLRRVRAFTDGTTSTVTHFNVNSVRGFTVEDSEFLSDTTTFSFDDDPAASNTQDVTFTNNTIVAAAFGSAEYPAHFIAQGNHIWLYPRSTNSVAFSWTGYDMKATQNTIWIAPMNASGEAGVSDCNGCTSSNHQWYGNIVLADNDISCQGPSGAYCVYLAGNNSTLSGGHVNAGSGGMYGVFVQDAFAQQGITVDHVGFEGLTGSYGIVDNQIFSGYDAFTFANNTLKGSATDAIYLANPGSVNAGAGRITGNTAAPGSSFGTFLSWTPANHPGILTDAGVAGTLVTNTGNVATATALAATPAQATSGQYCTGITAAGNCNSAQVAFGQLSGTAATGQIPTLNQNTTGVARYAAPSVLTVGTLPSSPVTGEVVPISDGAAASDCTTGGATGASAVAHNCQYNGSAWVAYYTQRWLVYVHANDAAIAASTTAYSGPGDAAFGTSAYYTSAAARASAFGTPCHMSGFFLTVVGAQSASTTTVTVYKNGSSQAITVSVAASSAVGTVVSDTTHSVDFLPTDTFAVAFANGSGATSGFYIVSALCQL